MAKKRLGEILIERGIIDIDQLNSGLAHQRQWGYRLGKSLVALGFVSEGVLTRILSQVLHIPIVDLAKVDIPADVLRLVRGSICDQFEVFPVAVKPHKGRRHLLLAMADPLNVNAIDEVAFTSDMIVRPAIAQISAIRAAIDKHYHHLMVDIPSLSDDAKKPSPPPPPTSSFEPGETMTITVGATQEERVIGSQGPLVDLSDEKEAERVAEYFTLPPQTQAEQPHPLSTPFSQFAGEPAGAFMLAVPPQTIPPTPSPFPDLPPPGVDLSLPSIRAPVAPSQHQQPPQVPDQVEQTLPPPVSPPPTSTTRTGPERATEREAVEELEKKFWALMRILARKGVLTREEFIEEIKL